MSREQRAGVEVASGVFVMTSTRYTTTSTIVRRRDSVLLVDPAWTVAELESIRDWVAAHHCRVTAGFGTHAHHDHLLWHPDFGDVPRWASPRTVELATEWHDELTTALDADIRHQLPDPFVGLRGAQERLPDPFGDGGDEPVELIVHDGHAPGHTAVWLPERGVLLAGDMLSDIELPLPFDPDDLPGYLDALDVLAPVVEQAAVLVPGHGHPTEQPLERLDADRAYLDAVLRGRDSDDARRALPGMDDAHRRIVEIVRAGGGQRERSER
jgi:glyoxylase-like metal-dependent hydrolase (beta-lactamase superfamily II)